VRQLHREFQRAGADVLQTLTFYSSDEKLKISGNVTDITVSLLILIMKILIVSKH
jgi:betaine-homocysteine S-methyltransferase